MAWKNFIIITVLVTVVAMVIELRGERRCGLFEYYDPHMDNCGPCSEICDHMELTRTEGQCRSQCSDYLIYVTCTYTQYYDDVVHSCAPCSELCAHPEITDTVQQCADKCQSYLKSLNCTEDEYFNVGDKSCSACSELCSRHDEYGDTTAECFHRCPKYVEKYPPGNIVQDPDSRPDSPAEGRLSPSKENDKSLSFHPGIILTIVIGLVTIIITISIVVYWVQTKRRPIYTLAPPTEVSDVEADITQANNIQAENPDTESAQQAFPSGPNRSGRRQEVETGNDGIGLSRSGIPECGPHQPSAPGYIPLRESVL